MTGSAWPITRTRLVRKKRWLSSGFELQTCPHQESPSGVSWSVNAAIGGFTSLLASFGAPLNPATPESIRTDFARVSMKQMRTWVSQNLATSFASKRQTAYAEFKKAA